MEFHKKMDTMRFMNLYKHIDQRILNEPNDGIHSVYVVHLNPDRTEVKIGITEKAPGVRPSAGKYWNSYLFLWCHIPGTPNLEHLIEDRLLKFKVGHERYKFPSAVSNEISNYLTWVVRKRGGQFLNMKIV